MAGKHAAQTWEQDQFTPPGADETLAEVRAELDSDKSAIVRLDRIWQVVSAAMGDNL
jgi:hypothetical protein